MKYLIGLALVACLAFGAWFFLWTSPQEEVAAPQPDVECHAVSGRTVVTRDRSEAVGQDMLIKEGVLRGCAYAKEEGDIELSFEGPVYFLALIGDMLLLDEGTAPPPRTLSVYNLSTRTVVFTDMYNRSVEEGANTFTYWQPVDTKPNAENCPDLASWETNGLGAGIERRVSLDLATLAVSALGETRCSARQ